jgi:hypothetical protein
MRSCDPASKTGDRAGDAIGVFTKEATDTVSSAQGYSREVHRRRRSRPFGCRLVARSVSIEGRAEHFATRTRRLHRAGAAGCSVDAAGISDFAIRRAAAHVSECEGTNATFAAGGSRIPQRPPWPVLQRQTMRRPTDLTLTAPDQRPRPMFFRQERGGPQGCNDKTGGAETGVGKSGYLGGTVHNSYFSEACRLVCMKRYEYLTLRHFYNWCSPVEYGLHPIVCPCRLGYQRLPAGGLGLHNWRVAALGSNLRSKPRPP